MVLTLAVIFLVRHDRTRGTLRTLALRKKEAWLQGG
jgi:hypothetical protein